MIELDGMMLCPYCFRTLGDSDICSCRYSRNSVSKNALPAGSVLGGRYVVGALLENFDDSLTHKYLCYDYKQKRKLFIKEFYPCELVNGRNGTAVDVHNSRKNLEAYNNCMQKYIAKVKTAQAIECEYSLKVLKAFFENNTAYFVVEPHPLLTVREYVENNNRITCEQAVKYLYQIMIFLSLTDREGVAHCGLKDTSVYIDEENDQIFIDGFESSLVEADMRTTTFCALNNYMHVKSGANPLLPVCDYFSAGAILYTLLTRKTPTSDIICDDRFDLFAFEKIADKSLRELIKKMCCIGGFEYRSFYELLSDANPVFERYGYEAIEVFDTQFEELRVISTTRKRNKLLTAVVFVALSIIIAICGFAYNKYYSGDELGEETTVSQVDEENSDEIDDSVEKDSTKENGESDTTENNKEKTTKAKKKE